jgi:hypothetical protein
MNFNSLTFKNLAYWMLGFLLLMNACQTKEVAPTNIPNDVSLVICADFKSMSKKAVSWRDMMNPDFINSIASNNEADILAKIFNSGIDYQSEGYLFSKVSLKLDEQYFGGVFNLNSESKFEKAIKDSEDKPAIKKEGKLKYAILKNNLIIAWEKRKVWFGSFYGQTNESKLVSLLDKIRKTKPEESLEAKNPEFKTLLQNDFDLAFWADYEKINKQVYDDLAENLPAQMSFLKDLTRLNKYFTGILNFEQGEITMKGKYHFDSQILGKYQELFKGSISSELTQATPIKNPMLFSSGAIGMPGVKKILSEAGILKSKEVQLIELMGIKSDEMIDMFSGDMVLAIKDINTSFLASETVEMAIGLGLKNKETLDKFLENLAGIPFLNLKKKDNYYVLRTEDLKLFMVEKANMIFITTTPEIKDDFLISKNAIENKYTASSQGAIYSFYVDVPKITQILPESTFKEKDAQLFKEHIMPIFESTEGKALPYSGNTADAEAKVIMKDKSKNALSSIVEALKKMAAQKPKKVS